MIAQQLLATGILQLGLFTQDNHTTHYRLRLEMLPAYPQLLQTIVYRGVQALIGVKPYDRLVAHADAIPLGTALSLQIGVSYVYSRGRGELPVHDLVGAYDVGHPSCLVINTLSDDTTAFIHTAQRVGLDIHSVLEVVASGQELEGIDQYAIYTMNALVHELQQANLITQTMAHQLKGGNN